MTEDRDFKKVVRERSAKTGESYQTARRQLEGPPPTLTAPVYALWQHPARGLVLGLVVEGGQVRRSLPVTVLAGETILHQGVVAGLRVGKEDRDVVTSGECGITLDPPFHGYAPRPIEEAAVEAGALRPVETVSLPYLVVG